MIKLNFLIFKGISKSSAKKWYKVLNKFKIYIWNHLQRNTSSGLENKNKK